MHDSTKCDNLTNINKVTKQKKKIQKIDILKQQFTSDLYNFLILYMYNILKRYNNTNY